MNEVLQLLKYFFDKGDNDFSYDQDEHFIVSELKSLGIPSERIQQVLAFMTETMVAEARIEEYPLQVTTGTRIFSPFECARLNRKCRSFLLNLEHSGVLSANTRELVLDQLLSMRPKDINLTTIKWVVLGILCNQPDKSAANSMERYLLSEIANCSH